MQPSAPAFPPENPEAFSYALVSAPHRDWLRGAADQARSLAYRSACDMIRIGAILKLARDRLPKRTFRRWCESELPWSRAQCYRLIAVADTFGPLIAPSADERFEPTALYLLARPQVPASLREYAVEQAAERYVTAAEARELLAACRVREPESAELRVLAPLRKEDRPEKPPLVTAFDPVKAWAALEAVVAGSTLVHISTIAEEEDEDEPLYSITVHREDDYPRNNVRRLLADAVLTAAGREPEKICTACQETKPVGEFGTVKTTRDGFNRYCKRCERTRLAAFKAKKREERKAAAEAEGP